ncbi:hypothetical protein GCM10011571_07230 [Marinithermofilum abyssi]|uniref:ABC transporter domain-containing protein n=1 Tax=Marinithermofilum abyssi TaxID=1571185 RepID=A0A8J2VGM2_9BACL|nr:ATP-binding cassette domain-containing protein [Marinithermofilum abyssi]GGE08475.1 hypothetical protein GCM10011571_07230 [Marinithermofilum abyssi]
MRIEWSHIKKVYRTEDDKKWSSRLIFPRETRTGLLDFSASTKRGITVVLGPKGSGKSTLLKVTATISVPNDGRVTYTMDNKKVWVWSRNRAEMSGTSGLEGLKNRIGYVPQRKRLEEDISVEEAMVYLAQNRRVPQPKRRAAELMARWGLAGYRKHELSQLPKSALSRYWLAQSLLTDPDIWLLDEPAEGLDELGWELLCQELLHHPSHRLTLIATNDLELAECADHLMLMEGGSCRRLGARHLLTASVPDGSVASWYRTMQTFSGLHSRIK